MNDNLFILTDRNDLSGMKDKSLYLTYSDFEELDFVLQLLEKSDKLQRVIMTYPDLDKLWTDFRAHFTEIDAAGGAVLNSNNELLLIHRLGKWDLPKGKFERDETPEKCALREVEEECDVHDLVLGKHLMDTYHCYEEKGERIMKRTFWFQMRSDQSALKPQVDEGITEVVWKPLVDINPDHLDTYPNIRLVIKEVHKLSGRF